MTTSTPKPFFLNLRNRSELPCVNGYTEPRLSISEPIHTKQTVLVGNNARVTGLASRATDGLPRPPPPVSYSRHSHNLHGPQATPTHTFVPPNNFARARNLGRVFPTPSPVPLVHVQAPVQLLIPLSPPPPAKESLRSDTTTDVIAPSDACTRETVTCVTNSNGTVPNVGVGVSAFVELRHPASTSSRVLPEDRAAGSGSNNISSRFVEPGVWKTLVQSKREDNMLKQSISKRSKCRGCM